MRVAIIYDRINKIGGAERVIQALKKIYPRAPIYTLVHNPKTSLWASGYKIVASFFSRVPFFRTRHEILFPFASLAFETHRLDRYDVVISVTSAEAKSVLTSPQTLHICYCLTPTRYYWSGAGYYLESWLKSSLISWLISKLRWFDYLESWRPDFYLAISQEVKKRIKKFYQRDSEVVYPGIRYHYFSKFKSKKRGDYYLLVGRLVPYKRANLVVNAFKKNGKRLVVVGSGSQFKTLKRIATNNISFVGEASDISLGSMYAKAKALIFPQLEDFGLIPLEAQATGCPIIGYRAGGTIETVIHNKTGILFEKQTVSSLQAAISKFESGRHQITAASCRQNARRFSEDRFETEFSAKVGVLWRKHKERLLSSSSPAVPAPDFGRSHENPAPSSSWGYSQIRLSSKKLTTEPKKLFPKNKSTSWHRRTTLNT